MKKMIILTAVLFWQALPAFAANPVPPEKLHPEWLACQADADCAVVEIGCTYWQPVNTKSKDAMTARYREICGRNLPPGPKPEVSCTENVCRSPAIAHRKSA